MLYSFNRTFMELKLQFIYYNETNKKCFNRTFMELKSLHSISSAWSVRSFNRTFMELKCSTETATMTRSHQTTIAHIKAKNYATNV